MAENAGGGLRGPSQNICHNVTAGLQGRPEEAATSQGGHASPPGNVTAPVASEGPLAPLGLFCCPLLFAPVGLAGLSPGSSPLPSTCVPVLAASTPLACCWLSETAVNPLLSSRAALVSYVTSPLGYVTTPNLGVILQFSLPPWSHPTHQKVCQFCLQNRSTAPFVPRRLPPFSWVTVVSFPGYA